MSDPATVPQQASIPEQKETFAIANNRRCKIFYIEPGKPVFHDYSLPALNEVAITDVTAVVSLPREGDMARKSVLRAAAQASLDPGHPTDRIDMAKKGVTLRRKDQIIAEASQHNVHRFPFGIGAHILRYPNSSRPEAHVRKRGRYHPTCEFEQGGVKYKWQHGRALDFHLGKQTLQGLLVVGIASMSVFTKDCVLVFNSKEVDEAVAVYTAAQISTWNGRLLWQQGGYGTGGGFTGGHGGGYLGF